MLPSNNSFVNQNWVIFFGNILLDMTWSRMLVRAVFRFSRKHRMLEAFSTRSSIMMKLAPCLPDLDCWRIVPQLLLKPSVGPKTVALQWSTVQCVDQCSAVHRTVGSAVQCSEQCSTPYGSAHCVQCSARFSRVHSVLGWGCPLHKSVTNY